MSIKNKKKTLKIIKYTKTVEENTVKFNAISLVAAAGPCSAVGRAPDS